MNRKIIKSYIEEYKQEFERVHKQEIYKWKAVKHFKDNFDIDSNDFVNNLEESLRKAGNLLDSGQYFPKRMLLKNTETSPEKVKEMFKNLYNEDFDFLERVENFRSNFKKLNQDNNSNKNDYQDHRALMVYLALNFPERYFFYKYRMFKEFASKVNHTYNPVAGRTENLSQFQNLCELVRYEISSDQELLKLHENRLEEDCYRDKNFNILTQDFIYAVVRHLNNPKEEIISIPEFQNLEEINSTDLQTKSEEVNFTPRVINHIQNNIENKRIGDLGEIWVLKHERNFLEENGKSKLASKVKHVAKDKGDGLGYDILSFELDGNEKFIEVKTTKGRKNSTFFITRNELEKSKLEKNRYFLYRVYEFNEEKETARLMKIKGDLSSICELPINYKVNLKKNKKMPVS